MLVFKHFRESPFIDATDRAALDSSGGLDGELSSGGSDASPEVLASFGIDPKEYEQIINENKGPVKQVKKTKKIVDEIEELPEEENEEDNLTDLDEPVDENQEGEEEEVADEDEEEEERVDQGRLRMQDYTRKTQALAKEKKQFEKWREDSTRELDKSVSDLEKHYGQFDQKLNQLDQWNHCVDFLKMEQPELFEELQSAFKQVNRQFQNPIYNNLKREIDMLKKQNQEVSQKTDSWRTQQEDQQIRSNYQSELKSTQTKYANQFKKLGLNVDWKKVTKNWIDTGADTIEQSLYNVYGRDMVQRYESGNRVDSTRERVERLRSPSINRGGRAVKKAASSYDIGKRSYNEVVDDILKGRVSAN